jgi:hypothetical protein
MQTGKWGLQLFLFGLVFVVCDFLWGAFLFAVYVGGFVWGFWVIVFCF